MAVAVDETRTEVTRKLCAFVAAGSLSKVPQDVVTRAKHLILDGLGCGLLSARLDWSRRAVAALRDLEGDGRATLWGWGHKVPPTTAALLNGTFVQGFELDDYHQYGPLHSEACVIPSVLATAEQIGPVTGARLLESVIYGFEIGPRVGIGMGGLDLVSDGWHCGAVYGVMASAAGAGKLRDLSVDAMEDAFGIAATQACGLMSAQYEAMVKRMHSGMAAKSGLLASALADAGFTGIKRVIERDYGGLAVTFSGGKRTPIERMCEGLGEDWEAGRISVKPPYSCMGGLHSSIDGARRLRERQGFEVGRIEKVRISVAHAMYHHAGWRLSPPATTIGAQMNLAYATAVALIDGAAFVPQFTPERMAADDIWNLIERTEVHWDEAIDQLGEDARWMSRVELSFNDGTCDAVEIRHPWGGRERPMLNSDVVEKFDRMTSLVMPESQREQLKSLVLNLENLDDVGEIVLLLAAPVKPPY